ncbi:MAG TPA: hypothetical protein VF508_06090, partial [Pyrinomonadaceae bacterium]
MFTSLRSPSRKQNGSPQRNPRPDAQPESEARKNPGTPLYMSSQPGVRLFPETDENVSSDARFKTADSQPRDADEQGADGDAVESMRTPQPQPPPAYHTDDGAAAACRAGAADSLFLQMKPVPPRGEIVGPTQPEAEDDIGEALSSAAASDPGRPISEAEGLYGLRELAGDRLEARAAGHNTRLVLEQQGVEAATAHGVMFFRSAHPPARVVAHELAHMAQQRINTGAVSSAEECEAEAERAAENELRGDAVS